MTRKQTVRLQEKYPVGAVVGFYDKQHASRTGRVVGHAKGRVLIESPTKRTKRPPFGLGIKTWRRLVKRHRIKEEQIQHEVQSKRKKRRRAAQR